MLKFSYENKELNVLVDIAGLNGTFELTLYDLSEGRTLATGSITIEQSSVQPLPFSLMFILSFVGLAIAIPLGVIGFLRATGRLKFGWPRLGRLRRSVKSEPLARHIKSGSTAPPIHESPVIEEYYKLFRPAVEEKLAKSRATQTKSFKRR